MLYRGSFNTILFALVVAVVVAVPAVAFAAAPPSTPAVIASENFDVWPSAVGSMTTFPSGLVLQPGALPVGSAVVGWWGRNFLRHEGTTGNGMWCAGSPIAPLTWPQNYPEDTSTDPRQATAGEASIDLTQAADYYSTVVSFDYNMPSLGAGEISQSGYGFVASWLLQSLPPNDASSHIATLTTSTGWAHVNVDVSNASSAFGNSLSRESGYFRLLWHDYDELSGVRTGVGPTVDNLVIAGYKFGPVRNLTATSTVTSDTVLNWDAPWRSTAATSVEERPIEYHIWRSPVGANTWAETTDSVVASTSFTDTGAVLGDWDYQVQVWDQGGGPGYGQAVKYLSTPPAPPRTPSVLRLGGPNRASVAVAMAAAEFPNWTGVHHIVIASGDDAAAADPLAAAGLAGAYKAPILLVSKTGIDSGTLKSLTSIAAKNPGVKLHIVGGIGSVPAAVASKLHAIPHTGTLDRVAGADRYEVTANIAAAMAKILGAANIPGALIVSSQNPAAFYDALAASPIAYSKHMPMLGVRSTGPLPSKVAAALKSSALAGKPVYVVSGPGYIGSYITGVAHYSAPRFTSSSDHYQAAVDIANRALTLGMSAHDTALAAKLPDALGGGAFAGSKGGVLLFTDSANTKWSKPAGFITAHKSAIYQGWVYGGTGSMPAGILNSFYNLIK